MPARLAHSQRTEQGCSVVLRKVLSVSRGEDVRVTVSYRCCAVRGNLDFVSLLTRLRF